MKKYLSLFLACLFCISMMGCTGENEKPKAPNNKEDEISEQNIPEFLYSHEWMHYDENCDEYINFNEEGEFSYHCACGSPVGDYDLYDSYSYDEAEKTIILSGEEDEKIELLYNDENYLVLKFKNSGVQVFVNENFAIDEYAPHKDVEVYASEGWVYLTVLSYNDAAIQLAPYDYEKDAHDSYAPYIITKEHKNDIPFKLVGSITENGETITKYYDLDEEKLEHIGDYYTVAYIHFDEEGEIDQGVFYGSLEIQESAPEIEDRVIN